MLHAAASIRHRRKTLLGSSAGVSANTSTLVNSSFTGASGTLTYTAKDASGAVVAGAPVVFTVNAEALVSAALSTVSSDPGTIANDGVASSVITVVTKDTAGDFVVGLPAANQVLAATGTGNTLTQPAAVSNVNGVQTGSIVSTVAATKTVSTTALGLAITDTAPVVVTGGAITYPNEPGGYTRFVETDYSALPANPLPTDGQGLTTSSPASNITLESGPARVRYHHIAGTAPGYSPPSYAIFSMWDTNDILNSTSMSEVYMYHQVKMVGTGGTYETPGGPGHKWIGYFGVANNGQNPATGPGPVQVYSIARPTDADTSSPKKASTFAWDFYTQMTGTSPGNRSLPQNENTGTLLTVGVTHTIEIVAKLNTVGAADGILQWWIDGTRVGNYTDVRWRDASYAQYGSTGLTGFFGFYMDAVWGGSGGANKTRDDSTDWFKTYISGIVGP